MTELRSPVVTFFGDGVTKFDSSKSSVPSSITRLTQFGGGSVCVLFQCCRYHIHFTSKCNESFTTKLAKLLQNLSDNIIAQQYFSLIGKPECNFMTVG